MRKKVHNPNPGKNGGRREGSGRKPDWLKEKCRALLDKHDLLEYLARVASGQETEERATKDGAVTVQVSAHDRMHAVEIILERGFGKPVQGVEVAGEGGGPVKWEITIVPVKNAQG